MPLSELVTVTPPMQLIRATEGAWAGGSGVEVKLLLRFGGGQGVIELFDLRLKAGCSTSSHAHPEGVVEHVRLHSGRLVAGPHEGGVLLKAGDYTYLRADVEHVYRAVNGKGQRLPDHGAPHLHGEPGPAPYLDVLGRD